MTARDGDVRALSPEAMADLTPRHWGVDPLATLAGLSTGIAAVHMEATGPCREVTAPPARDVHILSWITRGDADHRIWHDDRLVHAGAVPARSVNIVPAGVTPRALIRDAVGVLHVYLPHALLVAQAAQLGWDGAVEVVDPRSAQDSVIGALAESLMESMRGGSRADRLFADTVGQAMSLHVLRRWSNLAAEAGREAARPAGQLAPWQVRRVLDHLREHLAEDVSLGELAALVRLSPHHFCRAFRASTGLPPHRMHVRMRVERAKELLRHTDLSVGDIAAAVGYEEPSHLSRIFRQEAGVSPLRYRREQPR